MDPLIGAALISGASSIFGGISANKANKAAAAAQMAFQKDAAKHSYQWAMSDMKKAGLNPMLAYQQGGASALSGASYKAENVLKDASSTALQTMRLKSELKNIDEDTILKRQQGYTVDTQGALNVQQNQLLQEQIERTIAETHSAKSLSIVNAAHASRAITDKQFNESEFGRILRMIDKTGQSLNPFATTAKTLSK